MKTILTIDFDIIMDSYSELYSDKECIPWDMKLNCIPGLREMPVNSFHYEKVTNLLLTLFMALEKEKVHFIQHHHSICNLLHEGAKYNIINIDHHHDWFYKESFDKIKNNLDCGNWVSYCNYYNMINSYVWIKNETSRPPIDDSIKQINFSEYSLKDYDIYTMPKVDELYICFSPEYVPPYHYPLFFIWMSICSSFYKKHFDFED